MVVVVLEDGDAVPFGDGVQGHAARQRKRDRGGILVERRDVQQAHAAASSKGFHGLRHDAVVVHRYRFQDGTGRAQRRPSRRVPQGLDRHRVARLDQELTQQEDGFLGAVRHHNRAASNAPHAPQVHCKLLQQRDGAARIRVSQQRVGGGALGAPP